MEYAIVDIETTGGAAVNSGITEIAIVLHDGKEVTGRYTTLINPQRPIPIYITALTGITSVMVAASPTFAEVAEKIYNLLKDKIFVAHNANFDYSFVKHHLAEAGYTFSTNKLCTVRMGRKITPGLHSYSLGNLCRELDIPINNRHRAGGDADATAILFAKLLEWDTEGHTGKMLEKGMGEQQLPPNLPKEAIAQLPYLPGVYYFKDQKEKVIYVGKAKNLNKRVKSHFTGHNPNPQRQHFLRRIYHITYEVCGTELMAFLLEAIEIKRLWPEYNRALKKYEPKYGLFVYEGLDGFNRMAIGKFNKNQMPLEVFHRAVEGTKLLHQWVEAHQLCKRLCHIGLCEGCTIDSCQITSIQSSAYNAKTQNAFDNYLQQLPSYFIVGEGRDHKEQSIIWVEKGKFYGMGYASIYNDLSEPSLIKQSLTRYPSNYYTMQLINTFVEKHPEKIVELA